MPENYHYNPPGASDEMLHIDKNRKNTPIFRNSTMISQNGQISSWWTGCKARYSPALLGKWLNICQIRTYRTIPGVIIYLSVGVKPV